MRKVYSNSLEETTVSSSKNYTEDATMSLSLQSAIQIHPDVLSREVNSEQLILSFEAGEYFGLDGVGGFIWNEIRNPIKVSEVIENVVGKYDVTREDAEADIIELLNQLIEQRLAIVVR